MDPGHEGEQDAITDHEQDINMAGEDGAAEELDDADAQIEQQVVTDAPIDADLQDQSQDEMSVDGMEIEQGDVSDAQIGEGHAQDQTNADGMQIEQVDVTDAQIREGYEQDDTEHMHNDEFQEHVVTYVDTMPIQEHEYAAEGQPGEDHEQEPEMEPAPDVQNQSHDNLQAQMDDYDEARAQDGGSNFQPAFVEDEAIQNASANGETVQEESNRGRHSREDSSSLFVPEDSPLPASRVPLHQKPSNMSPPKRPVAHPSDSAQSMFSRIRNMQKANMNRKHAAHKRASTPRYTAEPDGEAYLEAVMAPITPSSSTHVPKVNEEVMEDRKALAEFERQKKFYKDLRLKNGSLTFRQDVEWMKIKGAEDARKNKQARDQAKARQEAEGDTELFPSANPTCDEDPEDGEDDSGDAFSFNASGSRKRQRQEMPRKEPKQMSMQEAELQSMKVALEAHEDAPKKKRKSQPTDDDSQDTRASGKGKGKAPKPRGKPKGSKATPKKATGPRKTAKSRREADHALKQASSLFGANVFEQQAGEHEREQPTFSGSSRKKQDALKELIASVPLEDKKQARSDMAGLLAATREFDGHGACKAVGGGWLVKGMKTSLKGYQVLGSAFMRKRENAAEEPLGGLMADQMGLGKTLMMLANIVNGQPPKGVYPRTTLLVASPALLSQWNSEIEQHTKCGLKVMRYGAGTRIHSSHATQMLDGHDIVLTTYAEVMRSYPKNEPPIECQTAEQKIAWWVDRFENHRGLLHKHRWLRIVLDEAQAIKNHTGRTSIACRALIAKHRWALSGTPIMNSLTELYPYFKFLGVPHTGSFKIFKHNYCDTKDAENTERLLVRLSQFMIRRTHSDRMFNAPILKLPQADQATYWCEFNPVERTIYDIVKERFTKTINMWQANGTLEKSYSNALVMLLRLRQLTAHVLMLQFVMRDLLELEDLERIKEVVKEHAADSTGRRGGTIIAIRKQLEQHAIREKKKAAERAAAKAAGQELDDDSQEDESPPEEAQTQEPDEPAGQQTGQDGAGLGGSGKNFGKDYNFKPFLASLKTGDSWEKAKKKAKCSYCDKTPRAPWIPDCGHLICFEPCLEKSNLEAAEVGKSSSPCKTCGKTPHLIQPCELDEDDPIDAVAQGTRSKAAKKTASKKKQRDREDISEDWLALAGADVLPSAKTLAIKAQILNWRKETPGVKIIIYTQFLAMVSILGKICQHEGWQSEKYVGTMSFTARDKAISTFANNPNCNILLASLRCGGLGLNLTMASRVIMMDPWWNSASEQQAFCRVFRIGQSNETYMSRLCVRNSVDARLIAMQEKKQKEINGVMEEDISRVKKMSIADLMRLFGNLDEDAEGKQFIMVDNPDPRGGFRADRDDEVYADDF